MLREAARRVDWLEEMTGEDPKDLSGYDLVINTPALTVEQAAAIIAAAGRASAVSK